MVGQGSFATVHKAKHLASGKSVALKVGKMMSHAPRGSTIIPAPLCINRVSIIQ